jgi:hypothetical protein
MPQSPSILKGFLISLDRRMRRARGSRTGIGRLERA